MTSRGKILFRFDANEAVGFGHAARCLKIASRLSAAGFQCMFAGNVSDGARQAMGQTDGSTLVIDPHSYPQFDLCVMDLMADSEDPEAVNWEEVGRWRNRDGRLVYIHSGLTVPDFPPEVVVIGYHPSAVQPVPRNVHWGVDFSPIERAEIPSDMKITKKSGVLVALGGAPDWSVHEQVVHTLLSRLPDKRIDILGSPVIPGQPGFAGNEHRLRFHLRVPSVYPLIMEAELVIASFGNLCYEALHLGAKLIVVGQKQFQIECGKLLECNGYCVSAGGGRNLETNLVAALGVVRDKGEELSAAGREAFDGRGIERIAHLIAETATK